MKKLSDTLYVQEEGTLLIHAHGPKIAPWCLVDTGDHRTRDSRVIALFADLSDALEFAKTKTGPETSIPGRQWSLG